MNQNTPKRNKRPLTRAQHRARGSWIFGFLLFIFFVCVFIFAPERLPEYKQRMLTISCALLSGLLAFFLTGEMGLEGKFIKSRFGNIGVKATGGIAVFVLVLWWWMSPFAPVGIEEVKKKVVEIKKDTAIIVRLLEEEFRKQLGVKDTQIAFLQQQLELGQKVKKPSLRARQLAAQIPVDADPYALALKAIAERRFDKARELLVKAQKTKEIELSRIYEAMGQTERFAGRYTYALGWYQKALALRPDDSNLLNVTAIVFIETARYAQAEPLCRRSLAIRKKVLGEEHPDVADSLNTLALFYFTQRRYSEAEPLFKRALKISEKALGPDHPHVVQILKNYAALLHRTNREAEAVKLEARAKRISGGI